MKNNWQAKQLEDCIENIKYPPKIQRKNFLASGKLPIISQEYSFINGYWNHEEDLFKTKIPVVIFGDHTQVLKYIDFDFVLGADGAKILQPKKFLFPKFFYYFLKSTKIRGLGYARHYRLLKEKSVYFPCSLEEQKSIVKVLDECFKKIDKAKENTEKNLQNARELFESYLNYTFNNSRNGWEEKKLPDICEDIFAGGDVPKNNFSKSKTEKYTVPIYANGMKDKGLYGFTDIVRVKKPCITISARGTIGYSEIRRENFFPVVRLIVVVPNKEIINLDFLGYAIKNISFTNSGSSIPQLTVPMVKRYMINFPSLPQQKIIVEKLDELWEQTKKLEEIYKKKLDYLEELKKSILHKAFEGEL